MRKYHFYALLVWVLGIGSLPLFAPDEITWLTRYSDAIREAGRTQKPIFLEFRCEA